MTSHSVYKALDCETFSRYLRAKEKAEAEAKKEIDKLN
jgi:hypothetical protein